MKVTSVNEETNLDIDPAGSKSLDEVNGSIEVPKGAGFWRTLAAYTGPGVLIAVGTQVTGLHQLLVALSTSTVYWPSS